MRRYERRSGPTCFIDETGTFGTGFLGLGIFTPEGRFPRTSLVPVLRDGPGTTPERKARLAQVPVLHATDDPYPLRRAVLKWIKDHARGIFEFVWIDEEGEAAARADNLGHKEVLDLMLKFPSIGSNGLTIEVEQRPGLNQESASRIAEHNDEGTADVLQQSAPHPFIDAVRQRCISTGERYVVRTKEEATAGLQIVDYLCWLRWRERSNQEAPIRLRQICTGGPLPTFNDAPVTVERYQLGI